MAIQYGTVHWRGLQAVPDTADLGRQPDLVPIVGTLSFRRAEVNSFLIDQTGTQATVFFPPSNRDVYVYGLDEDGRLRDGQGNLGVELIAGYWTVAFDLKDVHHPEFSFNLPASGSIDLGTVTPIDLRGVEPVIQGPPGASAYDTWLQLGNSGTEADFIASLQGPPGSGSVAGQQHDVLAGLSDDDHPQYVLTDGSRPGVFVKGTGITEVRAISQAAYNALSPKSPTTLYVITA